MNDLNELREHLFGALRDLRDPKNPMDIDRAKAVSEVAQTIINSAKVEVDHAKVTGSKTSEFLDIQKKPSDLPPGITGVTTHRIR